MRRVGDEAALRLERLLEGAEHRVERRAEPRELPFAALRHALARLAGLGDPLGRRVSRRTGASVAFETRRPTKAASPIAAERDEDEDQLSRLECAVVSAAGCWTTSSGSDDRWLQPR